MVKNTVIVLLLLLLLHTGFGYIAEHRYWFDQSFAHWFVEPLVAVIVWFVVIAVMLFVGFFVAVGVVASFILLFTLPITLLVMIGLSAFWPIVVLIMVVVLFNALRQPTAT